MSAVNGFTLTAPDARYGASEFTSSANYGRAQKFTCTGTGAFAAVSIGCYARDNGDHFVMAIFTHDASNNCPESLVENSVTSALTTPSDYASSPLSHTYSSKPILTGNDTYWIVLLSEENIALSYDSGIPVTSGDSLYKNSGLTYPTFIEGDGWHAHVDSTANTSMFVVYEAAAAASFARPSSDVAGGTFRSIHVTAPFGPRVIA